jgi:hypothetical protein
MRTRAPSATLSHFVRRQHKERKATQAYQQAACIISIFAVESGQMKRQLAWKHKNLRALARDARGSFDKNPSIDMQPASHSRPSRKRHQSLAPLLFLCKFQITSEHKLPPLILCIKRNRNFRQNRLWWHSSANILAA